MIIFYRRDSASIGVSVVNQGVRKTFLEALMFDLGVHERRQERPSQTL